MLFRYENDGADKAVKLKIAEALDDGAFDPNRAVCILLDVVSHLLVEADADDPVALANEWLTSRVAERRRDRTVQ